jgi:hypothetical protein
MKLQHLKEAEKGNIKSDAFKLTGKLLVEKQKDVEKKAKAFLDDVTRLSLLSAELDLLRTKIDADADDFNVVELKKRAVKEARKGPMSKNFPKVFMKRIEDAIKKGFGRI